MDTSLEYIKMCKKAVEVQIKHDFCDGDFVVTSDGINYIYGDWQGAQIIGFLETSGGRLYSFNCGDEYETGFISKKSDVTWLPRQDQLQEMVMSKYSDALFPAFALLETFYRRMNNLPLEDTKRLKSFEQLWLGYVMYMKFNKTWSGGNWE